MAEILTDNWHLYTPPNPDPFSSLSSVELLNEE